MSEKTETQQRMADALKEVTAVLEKYQVTFLPRIDYQEKGAHKITIALFDAKPLETLEEEKKND